MNLEALIAVTHTRTEFFFPRCIRSQFVSSSCPSWEKTSRAHNLDFPVIKFLRIEVHFGVLFLVRSGRAQALYLHGLALLPLAQEDGGQ